MVERISCPSGWTMAPPHLGVHKCYARLTRGTALSCTDMCTDAAPLRSAGLVCISSEPENAFVTSAFPVEPECWKGGTCPFIGLYQSVTSRGPAKGWDKWRNGCSSEYRSWAENEPSDPRTGIDCVAYGLSEPSLWYDYGCKTDGECICEALSLIAQSSPSPSPRPGAVTHHLIRVTVQANELTSTELALAKGALALRAGVRTAAVEVALLPSGQLSAKIPAASEEEAETTAAVLRPALEDARLATAFLGVPVVSTPTVSIETEVLPGEHRPNVALIVVATLAGLLGVGGCAFVAWRRRRRAHAEVSAPFVRFGEFVRTWAPASTRATPRCAAQHLQSPLHSSTAPTEALQAPQAQTPAPTGAHTL